MWTMPPPTSMSVVTIVTSPTMIVSAVDGHRQRLAGAGLDRVRLGELRRAHRPVEHVVLQGLEDLPGFAQQVGHVIGRQ